MVEYLSSPEGSCSVKNLLRKNFKDRFPLGLVLYNYWGVNLALYRDRIRAGFDLQLVAKKQQLLVYATTPPTRSYCHHHHQ
jgi:hypothetical protein